jgi:hypothetical protein
LHFKYLHFKYLFFINLRHTDILIMTYETEHNPKEYFGLLNSWRVSYRVS